MASIPLPALHIQPPAPPQNPLEQYGQLLQLRNQMQEAPLRQQAFQQQVQEGQQRLQAGQLGLQAAQEKQQDDAALRAATADPANHGQTLGQIADGLASKGAISQAAWTAAKKADADARKESQSWDTAQLENNVKATAANKALLENVMSLPDDQVATNWPQIVEQYNSIPGNNKRPLNPQQPLTKDQIQQQGPLLALHQAYLDDELARRDAATKSKTGEADLEKKQQDLQYGPSGPSADAKYSFLQKKIASKQPVTADDQAWMKGYEKQKLLVPATTAQIRIEGIGNAREYPVYDSKSKTTVMVTPMEINRAAKEEPGRYTAASYAPESVGAKDTTEYFTKGKGGQQLTAFNTAMNHLDTLDKLAADLNNTDIQVANRAKQAWAQQTGSPAPANFAAAKNAMSGEVAAALKASGATDQEITQVGTTFDRSQSPAQLKGAISTYRTLLKSKADNLQQQYKQGMQGKPNFEGGAPSGGGPAAGAVENGYRFKGGDPSKQANWEKVSQ